MVISGAVLVWALAFGLAGTAADTALSGLVFAGSIFRAARSGWAAAALGATAVAAAPSGLAFAVSVFRAASSGWAAFSGPLLGAVVARCSYSVWLVGCWDLYVYV